MKAQPSVNRLIFRTVLTVGAASVLPKVAIVVRELVVAARFGTSDALDAYLIALLVPSLIIQVVVGSFASALVPAFIHTRNRDGIAAARALAARSMGVGVALMIALTVLLYALAQPLLGLFGWGFDAGKLAFTRDLYMWLLPTILLQGAATFWGALLNAAGRFAWVAAIPVATPLLTIALLASPLAEAGVWVLVAGMVAGAALEATLTLPLALRHGLPPLPRFGRPDKAVREVIGQYLPMVGGMALMTATLVVDQAFASTLGGGSVATLNYGNKLVGFLLATAAMPLATAVLPHFSTLVAAQDWAGLRRTLAFWRNVVLAVSVPATAVLVALSTPIVALVFERGAFTAADTAMVAAVQQLYLLQTPFYLIGTMGGRMMSALRMNGLVLVIAGSNFLLNVGLNYLLMQWLGLPGLALATSLVYLSSTVMVFWALHRRLRGASSARE